MHMQEKTHQALPAFTIHVLGQLLSIAVVDLLCILVDWLVGWLIDSSVD